MAAGSSALVLLSLLISGYLFNLIFYPLRYFSSRAEGQKLFFMAAGAGLVLGAFVFGLTGFLKAMPSLQGGYIMFVGKAIDAAIPVPYACRLLLTIVAAVVGALSLNGILWIRYGRTGRPTAKRVYNKLTDHYGNPLCQLLRKAADNQKLVLITLKSRKIYCGRILEVPPNIEDADACVEILPSFSAYRDKDTLRMGGERTDYPVISLWEASQYIYSTKKILEFFEREVKAEELGQVEAIVAERERLSKEISEAQAVIDKFGDFDPSEISDWIKVISIKEIESASFYDPDAYKAWFSSRKETINERDLAI